MAKIIDIITNDGVVLLKDDSSDWRCCEYLFSPRLLWHLSQEQVDAAKAGIDQGELARYESIYTEATLPRDSENPISE